MNRKAFCVLLVVILCLLPGISRARYLNTATGRFQTMDTFAGDQQAPQSLHKYGYAGNGPVNNIDPSGHEIEEVVEVETVESGHQNWPHSSNDIRKVQERGGSAGAAFRTRRRKLPITA